jgi:hypothetical protein
LFADYDEKAVDAVVFASEQFFGTYYIIAKVYSVGFKDGAKKKITRSGYASRAKANYIYQK